MPAPAIDDTMKKAKNISTDRLNRSPAPDVASSVRPRERCLWSTRMRLCQMIVSTTGSPSNPTKINAPRQPSSSISAAVAGGAAAKPILPVKV